MNVKATTMQQPVAIADAPVEATIEPPAITNRSADHKLGCGKTA